MAFFENMLTEDLVEGFRDCGFMLAYNFEKIACLLFTAKAESK